MGKPRTCPDCKSEMCLIKLTDGTLDKLGYAAEDATRLWPFGNYPVQGSVEALMCAWCGRITFYGKPS
jgi:hypothetical protein